MDQTYIHLVTSHLPIFGSLLGAIVLIQGIWKKSNTTLIAAYSLFIFSALGAIIAYITGEAAEETAENIQGVAETMIEQHEDFAMFALISLCFLGFISLIGIFAAYKNLLSSRKIATAILLMSLISFVIVARTGFLGGQIRHTEINDTANSTPERNIEIEEND